MWVLLMGTVRLVVPSSLPRAEGKAFQEPAASILERAYDRTGDVSLQGKPPLALQGVQRLPEVTAEAF